MCGIAGLLYTNGRTGPIGEPILRMLDVLGSRGVDGTGVALYGPAQEGEWVLRVMLDPSVPAQERIARIENRVSASATLLHAERSADYLRLVVRGVEDIAELANAIEAD